MNASSVQGVMQEAIDKLEQLQVEAGLQAAVSINWFGGVDESTDNALKGTRQAIDFLKGEYRERVLNPGGFSEGLTGELAWEGWRDLADSTGQQLARIAGTIDKWDLSSTLARVALDTGRVIAGAVQSSSSLVPWIVVGLVALAFLKKGRS